MSAAALRARRWRTMGSTRAAKSTSTPSGCEMDEAFPIAGEGELVDDADDAVIVVLDFAFEAFAAAEEQGFERLGHGRPLVAHIGGHEVLDFGAAARCAR